MKKITITLTMFIILSKSAFGWDADSLHRNTVNCENGDAIGCANLGLMYVNGVNVQQDYFKAKELFVKACKLGDAEGCYNLGIAHEKGVGVRQDYSKAKELYGKACDMQYDAGCKAYADLNKR